jgi:hypothetical protein
VTMQFLAAVVAVLVLLCFVLLVTCAHILARVMRLEAAARMRAAGDGTDQSRLRVHSPVPAELADDLGLGGIERPLELNIVSAGCASCGSLLDSLCRAPHVDGIDRRIVVGHEADVVLLPHPCEVPIVVSSALVQSAVMSGWRLPVAVRIVGGEVVAIDVAARH